MLSDDTIAAIATAPGRAAVGIVRVSGRLAPSIAEQLLGRTLSPRRAALSTFKDADDREIDRGIAVIFSKPESYTGEDVLELQAHGNPVLLARLLARCVELGARHAEPGEFTRRAFLNGKLDLAQAEAVADLIAASSEAAARAALRAVSGRFSEEIQEVTRLLLDARVLVEAALDFPEEELDVLQDYDVRGKTRHIEAKLSDLIARAKQGKLLSEGVRVALLGAPNAGKSSVLNRLAREDVAIVTEIPGTTRDIVRADITLQGVPFHLFDTAGIRESDDVVEQIGIARAQAAGESADVLVLVVDLHEAAVDRSLGLLDRFPPQSNVIVLLNKADLVANAGESAKRFESRYPTQIVSAKTGAGFDALCEALLCASGWEQSEQSENVFVAHERQLHELQEAQRHLAFSHEITAKNPELIAEELRSASNALGKITGEVTSDDVLGRIFAKFCIGK